MSFIAKNPDTWAQAQPDDGPPPPAPIVLSVMRDAGPFPFGSLGHRQVTEHGVWCWSLDTDDPDDDELADRHSLHLQCGYAFTREAAIEAGRQAATNLGFTEVPCGWSDTGYGYVP